VTAKKSLREREAELRALLATPAGRAELEGLAARYAAADGHFRPARTSVVTYILVHERRTGRIRD
jgi:hypothetical protein